MKKQLLLSIFGVALALFSLESVAQVSITTANSAVTQNFDGMGATGTTTPSGWFVGTATSSSSTTVVSNNGSSNGGGNYNYGVASDGERALGSLASSSTIRNTEARFTNNTGVTITSITVSYDGEQWRLGQNGSLETGLVLQYSTNGSTYTNMGTSYNFVPPITSGTAGQLVGNTGANRVAGIGGTYTPASAIPNGTTIYLRWVDSDNTGADAGMAVDNFSITLNASSNNVPVASSVSFSGSLITGSTLTGSYTYSDTESDPEGTSTFRWFRSANASGTGAVAIGSATSITYVPGSSDVGQYLSFRVTPVATSGSLTGTEVASAFQGPIASATNSVSTITADGTFTPATNVDYLTSLGTDVTATSFEIARFSLNDVTGTPTDDGLATILTDLAFTVTGSSNLEKIALYDGTTELAEATAAATTALSGFSLSAASGTAKIFSVRVTFKTTVTDNAQPQLTISSATANPSGSLFAAANAGGASSSIAGDNNRIEVTATKLSFTTTPTQTVVNVAMATTQTVEATDVNNRRDLDFVSVVSLTSSGTLTTTPLTATATSGVASFTTITHTAIGTGLTLTASFGALTPAVSAAFNIVPAPIFANPITGTNPGLSNPYTNGQTFDANVSVSGIGRGSGVTGTNANDRYNGSSWDTASLDPTAYFEFTLTPVAGYQMDFTNFIYTAQFSASNAVTSAALRSSVDNFTANIGTATLTGTTISLTDTSFQNVSGPITFRLYAWGATNSGATFSVNSFEFNGIVEASPVPQISAAPSTITGLNYFDGSGPSTSQTIGITGANLTPASGNLTASATTGFEVSTDNTNFSSSVNVAYTSGTLTNAPLYVRQAAGTTAGDYSGTVTISGGNAPANATVAVSGKVVVPFTIPYFNSFGTQSTVDAALVQGFVASGAAFNTSYLRFNSIGAYLDTPVIDFTQESDFRVQFETATFGGNNGQTLELQISTDGGANYTTLTSIAPPSATYSTLTYDINVASYPSTNGKLRVLMTAGTSQTRLRNFYLLGRTTWDGTSWSAGAPNSLVAATIAGDYTTSAEPSINAYSLDVNSGTLTVTTGESVTLQNALTVNTGATAEFESNANLIQVNNVANTGNISISRTANMRRQDYIYWSSPVTGQNLFNFSDQTLSNRFYVLDEDTNSFKGVFTATPTGLGENATTYNFLPTKGYMVRAPNNHPSTVAPWTGTFTGVPNNGTYTFQATNGVATAAVGNNLIGNPYPSPINANSFLTANPTVGTLYFWAHITQTAPGAANYASFNGTGAAAAAGGEVPNGTIQVGQGFLVTVPAAVSIVFNNGMRVNNHQNQFFRSSEFGVTGPERHRIWLDLKKDGAVMSQSLVGYVSEATNGIEPLYDGAMIPENAPQLYSVIDNQAYSIQGRALPFADSDTVPMGIKTPTAGNYAIAMNSFDGLFGSQAVYIKDNATNVLHDIKSGDYTFATEAGTFNDRFQIVFNTTTLSIDQPVLTDNAVTVYKNGTSLEINSGTVDMQSVKIFDIRGRLVASRESINATSTSFANLSATQQVLLVQIVSKDGVTVTKKVIF